MENNNTSMKENEAGAFWMRKSKAGLQYLSGKITSKSGEAISLMVFKNKYKVEGSKQPDYRAYFETPREDASPVQSSSPDKKAPAKKAVPAVNAEPVPETVTPEIESEDIPF